MTDFVQQPVVQALAWALVHFLWQGAAIGLIVLAASRLVRSASMRYAIGVGALAAMLAAPVGTFLLVLSDAHGSAEAPASMPPTVAEPAARAAMASTGSAAASTIEWSSPLAFQVSPDVLAVAVVGWIAGVLFFSIRLLGGWVVARRLARNAVRPASAAMQALAADLCDRLQVGRVVRILESSALRVPVMVGWIKPAIVLPMAALASLAPAQVEALLAHELAHVRRHDYLVNLLQSVAEALLFYHPAVWWLSRRVRADRELCCDDLAVGVCDRLVYATALTDLATLASAGVALAATDGNLLGRIRRILGQPNDTASIRASVMPALALVLVAGVAVPVVLASATFAPDQTGSQDPTVMRLIGQVGVARSLEQVGLAFEAAETAQTPAQQAERQQQIEELRRKIEELQKQLARLDENRGEMTAAAEVRDRQAAEREQKAEAVKKFVDEKTLLLLQKDLEKIRAGGNATVDQQLAEKQELIRKTMDAVAANQELARLRALNEKGLVSSQQVADVEAAVKRAQAQGDLGRLAELNRVQADAELARARELFQKGLMSERQMQDVQLAQQKLQAAGDPVAEAAVKLGSAQADLNRRMELFNKGLTTQQDIDKLRQQIAMLQQQLKDALAKMQAERAKMVERGGGFGANDTDARALYEQLQRVQQNQGSSLGPFISNALSPAPNQDEPLKIGDVLRITISGEPDLPATYQVTADGTIRLPFVGAIKVAGMKSSDVRAAIGKQLADKKLGSASQVSVTLMRSR